MIFTPQGSPTYKCGSAPSYCSVKSPYKSLVTTTNMSLTDTFLHWISGRSVALTAFTIPFIGFLVALLGRGQSKKSHLPPGPKPLPLVGNMFDMSPVQPWKQYAQWTEKYGTYSFCATLLFEVTPRHLREYCLLEPSVSTNHNPRID